MKLTPERLDEITVDLIFALRDSLAGGSPSPLEFWGGRAATAITTAAAGSETMQQAITTACRKLQIDTLTADASRVAVAVRAAIDDRYPQWAAHVARNIVYIVALANVERKARSKTKKKPQQTTVQPDLTQEAPF